MVSFLLLVQLIREEMSSLLETLPVSGAEEGAGQPTAVNSVTIDYYLWNYAKTQYVEMQAYPIHRTRTVFY